MRFLRDCIDYKIRSYARYGMRALTLKCVSVNALKLL